MQAAPSSEQQQLPPFGCHPPPSGQAYEMYGHGQKSYVNDVHPVLGTPPITVVHAANAFSCQLLHLFDGPQPLYPPARSLEQQIHAVADSGVGSHVPAVSLLHASQSRPDDILCIGFPNVAAQDPPVISDAGVKNAAMYVVSDPSAIFSCSL